MSAWLKAIETITIRSALLCLAGISLSSCADGRTAGEHMADMPHWMGGLPAGVQWINYPYRVVDVRFIGTPRQDDEIDAQTV
jgi:hypothetical protein